MRSKHRRHGEIIVGKTERKRLISVLSVVSKRHWRYRAAILAFIILSAAGLALTFLRCRGATITQLIDILRHGDPFLDSSYPRRAGRATQKLALSGSAAWEMVSAAIDAERDEWARARFNAALACMRWKLGPYYIHTLNADFVGALYPRQPPPKGEWFTSIETFLTARDAPKLLQTFALGDPEASHYIFDALETLAPVALEPLLGALHDEHPYYHFCVTVSLMRVAPGTLPRLRQLSRDKNPDIRARAVWALGLSGRREAVPDLVRALDDSEPVVRWGAAYMLGTIPDPRQVSALVRALAGPDDEVACEAAEALGVIGDSAALAPLEDYARSGKKHAKTTSTSALAGIGEPGAPALLSFLKDPDEEMRVAGANALGELRSPATTGALLEALSDESPNVRYAAADALGYIGTAPAPDALTTLLSDPAPDVRASAARALGRIGAPGAAGLLAPLLKDKSVSVRWAAVDALGKLTELQALDVLIGCLGDPTLAPLACGEIEKSGAAATDSLLKAFSSTDTPAEGRCEIARLLAESGSVNKQVLTAFIDALEDPEVTVRFCADKALKILTRHETIFKPDAPEAERAKGVSRWRRWWQQHKHEFSPKR